MRFFTHILASCLFILALSLFTPVKAQDIKSENVYINVLLEQAYRNNHGLQAARQSFLAEKEQIEQAKAGYRPTLQAESDITYTHSDIDGQSFLNSQGSNTSKGAALSLSQPLYRGGSTIAAIGGAQAQVIAAMYELSAQEQQLLHDVMTRALDVVRDQAILDVRIKNIEVLKKEKERADLGFRVGELTKTDIAQAEARLSEAESNSIRAQADLEQSAAALRALLNGDFDSKQLIEAGVLDFLPDTLDDALDLGLSNSRRILMAHYEAQAADYSVKEVRGELYPQITAESQLSRVYDQTDFIEEQTQTSGTLRAVIPLYQAGATRSRLRAAEKTQTQYRYALLEVQEQVKADVLSGWKEMLAAKAAMTARQSQIDSARIAEQGVHIEAEQGERTILDKLNATQELLEAEVEWIRAKRDFSVAQSDLARILGILVPQHFGFSTVNP